MDDQVQLEPQAKQCPILEREIREERLALPVRVQNLLDAEHVELFSLGELLLQLEHRVALLGRLLHLHILVGRHLLGVLLFLRAVVLLAAVFGLRRLVAVVVVCGVLVPGGCLRLRFCGVLVLGLLLEEGRLLLLELLQLQSLLPRLALHGVLELHVLHVPPLEVALPVLPLLLEPIGRSDVLDLRGELALVLPLPHRVLAALEVLPRVLDAIEALVVPGVRPTVAGSGHHRRCGDVGYLALVLPETLVALGLCEFHLRRLRFVLFRHGLVLVLGLLLLFSCKLRVRAQRLGVALLHLLVLDVALNFALALLRLLGLRLLGLALLLHRLQPRPLHLSLRLLDLSLLHLEVALPIPVGLLARELGIGLLLLFLQFHLQAMVAVVAHRLPGHDPSKDPEQHSAGADEDVALVVEITETLLASLDPLLGQVAKVEVLRVRLEEADQGHALGTHLLPTVLRRLDDDVLPAERADAGPVQLRRLLAGYLQVDEASELPGADEQLPERYRRCRRIRRHLLRQPPVRRPIEPVAGAPTEAQDVGN
mmetsp:Transcript_64911/g.186766  ORF Transcript_64911/g.186766 Transcript_64911/m.186766 type:complete len:538 (+) Transcript_64911:1052-2665(+)